MRNVCTAVLVAALLWVASPAAAASFFFELPVGPVAVGSTFDVKVNVSGLEGSNIFPPFDSNFGPDLAFYQFVYKYSSSLLSLNSVVFGPHLGEDEDFIPTNNGFPGTQTIGQESVVADLSAQPDEFTLFTVSMTANAVGAADVSFEVDSGPDGLILPEENTDDQFLDFDFLDSPIVDAGVIEIIPNGDGIVPAPMGLLLLASGLFGLAAIRRS